jgi:serine/threonine protein kinase
VTVNGHPAFTRFICWWYEPQIGIVTEWLPGRTLGDILKDVIGGRVPSEWTPTVRSKTIFGVACGMLHLHNNNTIHRHLSPAHVRYDANLNPRLVDFGFSKLCGDETTGHTTINVSCNWEYFAPEILEPTGEGYDSSVDVFAFGMILYQLVTGLDIFPEAKDSYVKGELLMDGNRPSFPDDVDPFWKGLIRNCWKGVPNKRPLFVDIVQRLLEHGSEFLPGCDMTVFDSYRDEVLRATKPLDEE